MEDKIRGVEQELAMNTLPPLPHSSLVHLVGMAMEELKRSRLLTSVRVEEPRLDFMALNGFRIYNDMSHLELSTPSYNSPLEAVVYDKVGELLAYHAVRNLKGYFREVNTYKNNVSTVSNDGAWRAVSYSTHSSIIMDRATCNLDVWDSLEAALVPYMVARVPLIGGGDFVPALSDGCFHHRGKELSGETLQYVISPRAFFVKKLSSNDTVEARGLLNTRDDPHADPIRYWRLHDINWEGLRSPFQVYLRDCLEVLVMMAYEGEFLKSPPKMADPVGSIKEISSDAEGCDWKVSLKDGRRVNALEDIIEGFYLSGIEEMMSEGDPSEVDKMGFNLIESTLHTLGEGRIERLLDGLDWVTKKMMIEEYAPDNIEDALGICNQYALIDATVLKYLGEPIEPVDSHTTFSYEGSLEFTRDAIPVVDWDSLSGLVERALRRGPEGTREYLRSLVAREFPLLVESIEWERITFPSATIQLDEPFKFNREMCGDLLEKSVENFDTFRRAVSSIDRAGSAVKPTPVEDHEQPDKK